MKFFLVAMLISLYLDTPVAAQGVRPPITTHWVKYEGSTIEVEGYLNAAGNVVWNPGTTFNARSRERRSQPQPGPNERRPVRVVEAEAKATPPNFGLTPEKIGVSPESYTASSVIAARFVTEANNTKRAPQKMHVTVIGTDDERARVVNDIRTEACFADLREHLLVQDYKPGEWPVDPSLGFQAGKPSIVVQAAKGDGDPKGGRVVFRARDYSIGATGLAEAIRKADPNYRPDKDPTPDRPSGPGSGLPFGITDDQLPYAVSAVVALALVALLPRKGR